MILEEEDDSRQSDFRDPACRQQPYVEDPSDDVQMYASGCPTSIPSSASGFTVLSIVQNVEYLGPKLDGRTRRGSKGM